MSNTNIFIAANENIQIYFFFTFLYRTADRKVFVISSFSPTAPGNPYLLYSRPWAILSSWMWTRLVLTKGVWQSEELSFLKLDDKSVTLSCPHSISIAFSSCILWWSKWPCWRGPYRKELNPVNNYMSGLRRRSFPRRCL